MSSLSSSSYFNVYFLNLFIKREKIIIYLYLQIASAFKQLNMYVIIFLGLLQLLNLNYINVVIYKYTCNIWKIYMFWNQWCPLTLPSKYIRSKHVQIYLFSQKSSPPPPLKWFFSPSRYHTDWGKIYIFFPLGRVCALTA